ncbi:MAG: hypothetical protein VW830_13500, partial [Rhodobiaceae bacterium]
AFFGGFQEHQIPLPIHASRPITTASRKEPSRPGLKDLQSERLAVWKSEQGMPGRHFATSRQMAASARERSGGHLIE